MSKRDTLNLYLQKAQVSVQNVAATSSIIVKLVAENSKMSMQLARCKHLIDKAENCEYHSSQACKAAGLDSEDCQHCKEVDECLLYFKTMGDIDG